MSTRRAPLTLSVLAAATLLLSACGAGGGDDTAAGDATSAAASSAPAASTPTGTPAPSAPAAEGCTGTGGVAPATAATVDTIDLDGDGEPDRLWLADDGGTRTVGVSTAAGATLTHPVDLAGPAGATAFALRPDPAEPAMVLVSDNRVADLLVVQDCALVDATDTRGAPWQFDQGFAGQGTGVGCVDLDGDGTLDLVGLNLVDDTVTRTLIHVDGTVASAGASDEVAADTGAAQETARAITCGDRTLSADGVHEPS
ncbi:hypothetical protein [Cellulomonas sp. IC4_254]|uniref:hypothetical protein n=1 Tax=Cellulomonas sp. IC4_254 TaxID=2714040 RepID=UPI0014248644|nr:hypothetical protein [Cellulomonas sp. IC4_254]NHT16565.1 hypothetical protein [Cellulomonas sp. IC4_254]